MTDYFKILGIDHSATDKEVKEAYFRNARLYHPDTNQGDVNDAAERFKLISEAYQNLQTQALREEHVFEATHVDVHEDWTLRGRGRGGKYKSNINTYRQQYQDVSREFNEAEKRWQHANPKANAKWKWFEKLIHPRTLFFVLPVALGCYFVVSAWIKKGTMLFVTNMKTTGRIGAIPSRSSSSSSTHGQDQVVNAWFNPVSQRYETPAPWHPSYKASAVQLVNRDKVHSGTDTASTGTGTGADRQK
jgi:hypothetical protein